MSNKKKKTLLFLTWFICDLKKKHMNLTIFKTCYNQC